MFITVRSRKSIGEVRQKFEDASAARKFGVLGIHNVTATLQGKGLVFDRKLYIYEICNPGYAKKVLDTNIRISTALPCRVSIYVEGKDVVLETLAEPSDVFQERRGVIELAQLVARKRDLSRTDKSVSRHQ